MKQVPSQVTAECFHQRWFLSNRQMQGMLVIAEVEVGNCVRRLHRKGQSVYIEDDFPALNRDEIGSSDSLSLGSKRRLTLQEEAAKPSVSES